MISRPAVIIMVALLGFAASYNRTPSLDGHKQVFSMPQSVLLFSGSGEFRLVTSQATEVISIPVNPEGNKGTIALASLAADASVLTSGFPVANDEVRDSKVRCQVGVYYRSERKWRTYGNFGRVYATALSPDRSRVAFIAEDNRSNERHLWVLDIKSGQMRRLAAIPAVSLTWALDGQRVAMGTVGGDTPPEVVLFDLTSSSLRVLGTGTLPSWSPQGNRIAYLEPSDESNRYFKVRMMNPDGTGAQVTKEIRNRLFGHRFFGLQPVWSPDGTQLLLNEYKGDGDYQDVILLDVKSGKTTRMSKNGYPIVAWVAAHKI